MNVTIQQTPQHSTFDGHLATYCICRDTLTAQRVAMFQIVDLGEGVIQYRTMDRRSMPPDFTLNEAINLAMADEQRRRAQRPPKPQRPAQPTPPKEHSILRNIRPMQLPPNRGFRQLPPNARPMRRRLCEKLAERYAMKGVA